jgi:hypothetical protein
MFLSIAAGSNANSASGSDTVSALLQAAATVAAVLVGWLLSVLTERRSWKRRKVEQVRDRQLSSALDALGVIGKMLSLGEELAAHARALGAVHAGTGGSETTRLLRGPRAEAVETIANRLDSETIRLQSFSLELRFFGFPNDAVARMESCAVLGRGLVKSARDRVAGGSPGDSIEVAVSSLRNELTALVMSGPALLRG